jgi:mannosyltransferase OCH1-like enzyme
VIPKIIHQIWFGPESFRPIKLMRQWETQHPDWEYYLWTNDNIELFNQDQFDWCEGLGLYGRIMQADITKYEMLLRFGGIYIDADAEVLKPLNASFLNHEYFASKLPKSEVVAIHFLGCEANHPLNECLVKRIKQTPKFNFIRAGNYQEGDSQKHTHFHVTSNGLFMNSINETQPKIFFYPSKVVIPASVSDIDENTFVFHHWGHRGMDIYEDFSIRRIKMI